MNLLDSHDTERLRWTLTPGRGVARGEGLDPANVAVGKRRVRVASAIQFTVPGAPTVFYGDEVGLTGDDDPDDRRPYRGPTSGARRIPRCAHYRALSGLRTAHRSLVDGDFRILLADDAAETVAYGPGRRRAGVDRRREPGRRRAHAQDPLGGFLPSGACT